MKRMVLALATLLVGATTLAAQAPAIKPEIRPFAGAIIPTGDQRNLFRDAPMVGVQAAIELKPSLHVVGTFAWVPAQDKYPVAQDNVNIFKYDVGLELGFVQPLGGSWELRPFIGAGVGARTYAYQASTLSDKTCTTGYAALGTEFQLARTALRIEARDNVFCFRSPIAGAGTKTRNDIGLAFGVAYHLR
ncbi:MAG TPA: outer membrane beta-barrel protein [Gemmatimonadales bacterium]|nr:outer membrane beta-barrel protein [Gemmatimonadales bacterium]